MKTVRVNGSPNARTLLALALALACGAAESQVAYVPRQASPPKTADYVTRDGAIQIYCSESMKEIMERLNELYAKTHPGTKFKMVTGNDLAVGQALSYGVTAFGPVGTQMPSATTSPFRYVAKGSPVEVRIAHASLNQRAKVSPMAIVVNKANPLASLSQGQVTKIFTVGGLNPDITHWEQLGADAGKLTGKIHPYGLPESNHYPAEDAGFGEYMFVKKFGNFHNARNYEMLPTYAAVVQKVAGDPAGIGITAMNRVTPEVKVLAIKGGNWNRPSKGSKEDLVAGKYAYDRYLYIYARTSAGAPIDPFMAEYLRMALSREGQAAIAGTQDEYLPLSATEVAVELKQIEE